MEKKIRLFVVYGSETELLSEIYEEKNSYFIRIFNNKIPKPLENASDVDNIDNFKIIFKELFDKLKPTQIIFIGAAFLTQKNFFINEKIEDIKKSIDVNIIKYIDICHFILPFMIKIRSGNLIYLSSFRSNISTRGISLYSASKAFGEKFFEVLGKENGIFGVYSTSIRMGYFDGRMVNEMPEEKIQQYKLSIGNRRLGNKNDLIKTIKFILDNDYLNGGVIELTGGISF